jgi:SET domain-containing protein
VELYGLDVDDLQKQIWPLSVDGKRQANESRFVNHSCTPNACVRFIQQADSRSPSFQEIAFVANREIKAGKEITISYFREGIA